MKTKQHVLFLFVSFTLLLTSCLVKVEGCMNENAENYNADATKDDGSCYYEGSYIIWFSMEEGSELSNDGVEELNYYVDGQYLETTGSYSYLYSTPSCADELPVYFSRELSSGTDTENFAYSITDQDGDELYSGTGKFEAGKCKKIELE